MAEIPDDVQERLKPLLKQIANLFKAPRIMVIVLSAEDGNAKGNLVFGNANPTEAIEALRSHMAAEAVKDIQEI